MAKALSVEIVSFTIFWGSVSWIFHTMVRSGWSRVANSSNFLFFRVFLIIPFIALLKMKLPKRTIVSSMASILLGSRTLGFISPDMSSGAPSAESSGETLTSGGPRRVALGVFNFSNYLALSSTNFFSNSSFLSSSIRICSSKWLSSSLWCFSFFSSSILLCSDSLASSYSIFWRSTSSSSLMCSYSTNFFSTSSCTLGLGLELTLLVPSLLALVLFECSFFDFPYQVFPLRPSLCGHAPLDKLDVVFIPYYS